MLIRMPIVWLFLFAALVAATTLPTPARPSGIRNINNGVLVFESPNISAQIAKRVTISLYGWLY